VRSLRDEVLKAEITRVFNVNYRVHGADKVWAQLGRDGARVARCTVERLMRELGIHGVVRGRTPRTTTGDPAADRPGDLVQRQFRASAPNRLWVADPTYLRTWSGWVYAAFVIDVYSCVIVGWQLARTCVPIWPWTRWRWRSGGAAKQHADQPGPDQRTGQVARPVRTTDPLVGVVDAADLPPRHGLEHLAGQLHLGQLGHARSQAALGGARGMGVLRGVRKVSVARWRPRSSAPAGPGRPHGEAAADGDTRDTRETKTYRQEDPEVASPTRGSGGGNSAVPPVLPSIPLAEERSADANGSVGSLVREATNQVSTLLRAELELARSEVTAEVKKGLTGSVFFLVALTVVLFSLFFFFIAVAELLTIWLMPWAAYLIVFGVMLLFAGLCGFLGYLRVRKIRAPERTISSVKDTAAALGRRGRDGAPALER
jgi:hypothetical protein